MELKALEDFACYPFGDSGQAKNVAKGETFTIEDREYAELLIMKGHVEEVAE